MIGIQALHENAVIAQEQVVDRTTEGRIDVTVEGFIMRLGPEVPPLEAGCRVS